jgi:hypothetical protein
MDRSTFWKIIDTSRKLADGDLDEHVERLRSRLEELEPAEIVEFGRIFEEYWIRAYTWELWAAAYIIGGGCSDDGFLDFRGWLISKGEKVYERALRDPESLARVVKDDEDCKYEGFQYVSSEAWKNKPGNHGREYPDHGLTHPLDPAGERWSADGDELERRFPKLWKKFSGPPPRFIQIVAAPPGEAPPAIRAAWIGCVLPLIAGTDRPEQSIDARGVTSGRPEEHGLSYRVQGVDAILVLEQHDAEAARWWREHAPRFLQPGKLFAFSAAACELLPLPKA